MTQMLQNVFDRVCALPEAEQDRWARRLLDELDASGPLSRSTSATADEALDQLADEARRAGIEELLLASLEGLFHEVGPNHLEELRKELRERQVDPRRRG